ncbi:MAG: thiolase domain-containing protein [Candidatus Bathyarchaeota archaeon]|nr:MAG: thiolase domain-containing protein [Candidatus Bathyarchaeota archaeon]
MRGVGVRLSREIAIIGAGMTRFHHKLHADKTSRELFVKAALEARGSVDNGFELPEVEALFVGNFSSDAFEGQIHMAALAADWLGICPRAATRVEDACASSGVAMNVASMAIASGAYDIVMVGGVEKMRGLRTEEVTDTLAMAADAVYEVGAGFTFPGLFAALASAHFAKHGSNWEQLAAISIKNHHNGALNPKAHFQSEIMETARKLGERNDMTFEDELEFLRSPLNPVIAHPLRLFDCCPVSDGAAVLILAAGDVARKFTDTPVYIRGIGQASDTLALHDRVDLTTMNAAKIAAAQAYEIAWVKAKDIDVADVHDCFTIAELLATEDLGFFPKGEGGLAAENGRTALDGDVTVNPDGGLKAKGHPIGATGAAMAYEIFKQLRGEAGRHQVDDVEYGLTHNMGGSGATVSVQVYGR